jgi:superfamily I DNA and RNA helicase
MSISQQTLDTLLQVVDSAKARIVGVDLLKNNAEAQVLTSVIQAFGDCHTAFIYVSPCRAGSVLYPPDVVLCHPDVGLLILEAKSHSIDKLLKIEAGSIWLKYWNKHKPVNVIRQAEDQMYEIQNDLSRIWPYQPGPLIVNMVAFPNISEDEWRERNYHQVHPCAQLLLREQILDPDRLKRRVESLVQDRLQRAHLPEKLSPLHLDALLRIFGNSQSINSKPPLRPEVEQQKLGAIIDQFNAQDHYLSAEQKQLAQVTVGGFPRLVRGVAGSGKTIVLAEQVARYLYRQLPGFDSMLLPEADVSVAVVCFNQTLADFLRRKVQTAYKMRTLAEEVPSKVLLITHLNNLFWTLCKYRSWPLNYISTKDVPDPVERAQQYRSQIATFAENEPERYHKLCFDALFIDEGQDFDPEEYKLLLDLVKTDPHTGEKTLIIFYDDAQNVYGRPRPVWQSLGINIRRERSRVMRRSFRNTRQIVELAFNVLLGTQAPATIKVQTKTFADLSYLRDQRLIEESENYCKVWFAERDGLMPQVKAFVSHADEVGWVAQEIVRLLKEEAVRPEDILVLFQQPAFINLFGLKQQIQQAIPSQQFIEPYGTSVDKHGYIFRPGYLTLSTVYGAKGYDAPIVFLIGSDRFDTDTKGRAAFYVGATRAKLLLYVTGMERGQSLLTETKSVLNLMVQQEEHEQHQVMDVAQATDELPLLIGVG